MAGLKDTSNLGLTASQQVSIKEDVVDIDQYRSLNAPSSSQLEQSGIKDYIASRENTPVALKPSLKPGRITGPVQVLIRIIDSWNISLRDTTRMLGYEDSDQAYVSQILGGYTTLRGRDPKDRISNLFIIRSSLSGLFRDEQVENSWLRELQPELGDLTPFDYLTDGSMEKLLRVRQLVDDMSGKL